MKTDLSQKLFQKALTLFPGGVNSPVRAFRSVGMTPLFIARARGGEDLRRRRQRLRGLRGQVAAAMLGRADVEVDPGGGQQLRTAPASAAPSPRRSSSQLVRERAPYREDALRLLRHRGHHGGHPAGARIHRP